MPTNAASCCENRSQRMDLQWESSNLVRGFEPRTC
jgi:hypothetical protein